MTMGCQSSTAESRLKTPFTPYARFGYGLSAFGGGLFTPYGGMRIAGDGGHYRVGSRLDLGSFASVSLESERRRSEAAEPEHALTLRGEISF